MSNFTTFRYIVSPICFIALSFAFSFLLLFWYVLCNIFIYYMKHLFDTFRWLQSFIFAWNYCNIKFQRDTFCDFFLFI